MKITYWGTAAAEGIPGVFCNCALCTKARELGGKDIRTRSQMLIDDQLLVDMGPDSFSNSLRFGKSLMDIEHILITHSHNDHFYGAELVMRVEPYGHNPRNFPLNLYGNAKVKAILKDDVRRYNDTDCFWDTVKFHEIKAFESFKANDYIITPLPAAHDPAEDCFIFDILSEKDGKRLLYGNDTTFFPEETLDYLRDKRFDLLSLDCTMGDEEVCPPHMTFPIIKRLLKRLWEQNTADNKTKIIVTHFSHNAGLLHSELCERADKLGFEVAYDGMDVII